MGKKVFLVLPRTSVLAYQRYEIVFCCCCCCFPHLFMSRRIYPPGPVTLGYSPLGGTVTTSKRDSCWACC